MSLTQRIKMNSAITALPQMANPAPVPVDGGLHSFEAAFVTDLHVVFALLSSPEMRLSDHLNGSTAGVPMRPTSIVRGDEVIDLAGTTGVLTKAQILYAIPLREPERPQAAVQAAWKPRVQRPCWTSLGAYTVSGTIHTEAGYDPVVALGMLDKHFLPLTHATVHHPDGSTSSHDVILVNRHRLGLLAIHPRFPHRKEWSVAAQR